MNIDVWETSRSYTKLQVNMSINSITRQLLKHHLYQHLKYVPTTVRWNPTNLSLLKILLQENHSVNLKRHLMSNIRLLLGGSVHLRTITRQKRQCVAVKHYKALWSYKNKPKYQRGPLPLDSTSPLGCVISNCKLLSLCLYWRKLRKKHQCQICYYKFLYKNFIISWWVLQKKVYWQNQGTKTIILSSVIQTYKIFFHYN